MIVEYAGSCIGTPFRHQGRVPGVGLDCAGLIAVCLDHVGITYNDEKAYSRRPIEKKLEQYMDAQPNLDRVDDMRPGDVLLFRIKTHPQHLAICAGETIIHAFSDKNGVVENPINPWLKNLVAIYRVRS